MLDPEERLDTLDLRRHQFARLQTMLEAVLPHNVFYHNKLTRAGVHTAADLSSLDALRHLPFTTKAELLEDQAQTPPYGTLPTFPLERYVQEHHTSGTSGRGLRWLDTRKSWEWLARCWVRIFRAAGVTRADSIFFPFSFGPFVGVWSGVEGARRLGCLVIPGGGKNSLGRVNAIMLDRPTVMVCSPTYALRLAEVAAEAGIDLARSALRVTIHAGEPGASLPATKARLGKAFGAEVFDHAGATEVGAWGCPCGVRENLHILEEEFVVEWFDPATGEPLEAIDPAASEPAEPVLGELVLTNLGRIGSPVVRYRTGDIGRLCVAGCPSGRPTMYLDGGVLARADDMFIVRGINVYPSAVDALVREAGGVVEYSATVRRSRQMAEVELEVEPETGADARSLRSRLQDLFEERLSLRVPVRIAGAGSLPRYELKANRFTFMD